MQPLVEPRLIGERRTIAGPRDVRVFEIDADYRLVSHTIKTPAALYTASQARIEYERDRDERHRISTTEFIEQCERIAAAAAERESRRLRRDKRNQKIKALYGIHCPRGFIRGTQACGRRRAAPARCHDPLCPDCERIRAARTRARWLPVLDKFPTWRMLTLTHKSSHDPAEAMQAFDLSFRRWLALGISDRGLDRMIRLAHDEAVAIIATGKSKRTLKDYDASLKRFSDEVEKIGAKWKIEHPGPAARFQIRHLLQGLAALELTHGKEHGYHPHRHLLLVGRCYIPNVFITASWKRAARGQGRIADIRALKGDDRSLEAIKYISKPGSVPPAQADGFRAVIRGRKRVRVLGGLKPVTPDHAPCPACGSTVCAFHAQGEMRNGRDNIDLPPGQYHATIDGQAHIVTISRDDIGLTWDSHPLVSRNCTCIKPSDGQMAAAGPPGPAPGQVIA